MYLHDDHLEIKLVVLYCIVVVITRRFGYVSFISIAAVIGAHGSGRVGSLTQRCPTATLLFVLINDRIELN